MGRKAKPTRLKILDGNPGCRKINKDEPDLSSDVPNKPGFLVGPAAEEWDRLASGLNAIGLLNDSNKMQFAAYCSAFGQFVTAERGLAELREQDVLSSLIHITKNGNIIPQPLIGICNKAKQDMVKYATEFGLTPSSLTKVSVDKINNSKFGKLING